MATVERHPERAQLGTDAFEALARAGFVARAAVYGIIGALAVGLAAGIGGRATDQQGALRTVARQPFGHVLLVLVAIGLGGYALWRLVRAVRGRGPEATDSGFDRIAAAGSGLVYAILCALAVQILNGSDRGSGSEHARHATGGVLGWPGGPVLVGVAGVVLVGVGLYQAYRGVSRDFLRDSKTGQMSEGMRRAFETLGTVGHLARAVVFALVGVFLVDAAATYDPGRAVSVDGALARIARAGYGPLLLGIVAAGLVAFALYSLADARYRRI